MARQIVRKLTHQVLSLKKNVVAWTLNMQKCELSISLQQLKFKVENFIQILPTPFQYGLLGKFWWYWFKCKHPKLCIHFTKSQKVFIAQVQLTSLTIHLIKTCKHFTINIIIKQIIYGIQTRHESKLAKNQELG